MQERHLMTSSWISLLDFNGIMPSVCILHMFFVLAIIKCIASYDTKRNFSFCRNNQYSEKMERKYMFIKTFLPTGVFAIAHSNIALTIKEHFWILSTSQYYLSLHDNTTFQRVFLQKIFLFKIFMNKTQLFVCKNIKD